MTASNTASTQNHYIPDAPIVEKLRTLVASKKLEEKVREQMLSAPQKPIRHEEPKLGRNDPCHCGSGKKYKKCCLLKDEK